MKRVVLAGCGTRALNYADGILNREYKTAQLVALFDNNASRIEGFKNLIKHHEIPAYTDWDQMLREAKPDTMVILVPDRLPLNLWNAVLLPVWM